MNATPLHGEMQYDIVTLSACDFIATDDDTATLVKNASHFIFGSLATRNKVSSNTLFELIESAQRKVLDINLRAPHYNRLIAESLLHKADMVKMNIHELELITGWFAKYKKVTDRIQVIQERFQIPDLIVTMGAHGAIVNMNGQVYHHPGYVVKVADTIGSGDSFLAAFLSKQSNGASPAEALTFASALGALVASKTGGWPSYDIDEIQKLAATQTAAFI